MKSDSGRLNFSYVVCSVQDLTVKAQIISKEVKDAQTISVKKKNAIRGIVLEFLFMRKLTG